MYIWPISKEHNSNGKQITCMKCIYKVQDVLFLIKSAWIDKLNFTGHHTDEGYTCISLFQNIFDVSIYFFIFYLILYFGVGFDTFYANYL